MCTPTLVCHSKNPYSYAFMRLFLKFIWENVGHVTNYDVIGHVTKILKILNNVLGMSMIYCWKQGHQGFLTSTQRTSDLNPSTSYVNFNFGQSEGSISKNADVSTNNDVRVTVMM